MRAQLVIPVLGLFAILVGSFLNFWPASAEEIQVPQIIDLESFADVQGTSVESFATAYLLSCESTQTGFWDVSSTWTNCGGGVPGNGDTIKINNGHVVTIRTFVGLFSVDIIIESGGELILEGSIGPGPGLLVMQNGSTVTNNGKLTIIGGEGFFSGSLIGFAPFSITNNNEIIINGGSGIQSGQIQVQGFVSPSFFDNHGIISITGGSGSFAGLLFNIVTPVNNFCDGIISIGTGNYVNQGPLISHGIITVSPSGLFDNRNIIQHSTPLPSGIINQGTILQIDSICSIQVDIDIKPGSDPNSINTKSGGTVPVAILGSDTFDVTDVDVTTLAFGPSGATPKHDLTDSVVYISHLEDVNNDGFTDLVSHYVQKETGLLSSDIEACITGQTTGGTAIEGCDSVRVK